MLDEIGAGEAPRLIVFNKIDLLDEAERRRVLVGTKGAIGVSAVTGEGIEELLGAIEKRLRGNAAADASCSSPTTPVARSATCTRSPGGSSARTTPDGVLVSARVPAALAHRFGPYELEPAPRSANGAGGEDSPGSAAA